MARAKELEAEKAVLLNAAEDRQVQRKRRRCPDTRAEEIWGSCGKVQASISQASVQDRDPGLEYALCPLGDQRIWRRLFKRR